MHRLLIIPAVWLAIGSSAYGNPRDDRGRRPHKHHQWLTEDVGHPTLAQHLHAVIGLMRASATWDQFHTMLDRAFPKRGSVLQLELLPD